MRDDQILTAASKYYRELIQHAHHNRAPGRWDAMEQRVFPRSEDGQLKHVMWMCLEIPMLVDQGKLDKAMRWLGFVQGVLWACRVYTIDEMRAHNR